MAEIGDEFLIGGRKLAQLKNDELKQELEKRGLKKSGNKAALVERLSEVRQSHLSTIIFLFVYTASNRQNEPNLRKNVLSTPVFFRVVSPLLCILFKESLVQSLIYFDDLFKILRSGLEKLETNSFFVKQIAEVNIVLFSKALFCS